MTAIRKVTLQITHCQFVTNLTTDYTFSIDRFGFIDGHAMACADYWGFSLDKKGSYLYLFTPKDTVDKYGRDDIISSKRYDCRYVVRGNVLDELNCRLSYPPTQEMIDAGVLVIYSDGHSWKKGDE